MTPATQHLADTHVAAQLNKKKESEADVKLAQDKKGKEKAKDAKPEHSKAATSKGAPSRKATAPSTSFAKEESFSLFTLAKHDGRLTLRNIKFHASDSDQLDAAIAKHPGQYVVIKKNNVMRTNCFQN